MSSSDLSNFPVHTNTPAITRFFADGFPIHAAVHEVSHIIHPPDQYTLPHIHEGSDEVNIIISKDALLYKIQLGETE